ncbi:hypothetical protein Drose_16880 [Dactylosporangium roseum]|uniref:Thiamine pyrophosphate enzyme N-terminal TPP-binding domain-containing protein n=1 Tax=Dactylosporangium roseum TaxID=47989 RepID=A0ABY5ZC93_9ACTN|nr:thiamine pyrophosphate-binding protein [Dactylosporangium roseum]UWZ39741.1 hypothetical protein Drose_16880 [Dactylosporangium roseum]
MFAYPGDGINGMLGAFARAGNDPEFIQPRHEEMGAFMACAHAKFTGEVGCCMATSGPGAIHLLNGLYDAKMDHQPVVAIVGQQKRMSLGAHFQQEVGLECLFANVSAYSQTVMDPAQVRSVIDRAFKIALTDRSVAAVIIPEDCRKRKPCPRRPRNMARSSAASAGAGQGCCRMRTSYGRRRTSSTRAAASRCSSARAPRMRGRRW